MIKKFSAVLLGVALAGALALPAAASPAETSAVFSANGLSVTANSSKDLSNVVLGFCDDTGQKFDNLSGYSATFSGTGSSEGKELKGVWIKSGNNHSGDGPGYGEWHERAGSCGTGVEDSVPDPIEEAADEVCLLINNELVCLLIDTGEDLIFF